MSFLTRDPLAGLLHDASEAYIGDIPTPLKKYLAYVGNHALAEMEDKILEKVFQAHGLPYPMTEDVKLADAQMLVLEAQTLFKGGVHGHWEMPKVPKAPVVLEHWDSEFAMYKFLKRYNYLMENREQNASL